MRKTSIYGHANSVYGSIMATSCSITIQLNTELIQAQRSDKLEMRSNFCFCQRFFEARNTYYT